MRHLLPAAVIGFALLFGICAPLRAQNSGIDRRFGTDGMVSLRDPSQSNFKHVGVAACAAPGGTLNVLAMTKETFLTLFRLRKNGSLDTSFSGDGMATMTVPSSFDDNGFGSCMADGRIVVVRHAPGVGSDMNVQIFRVMPDGTLDPGFASGSGVLTLDMDQYVPGLANAEYPTGLNLDAAGNIFISLRLYLPDGQSRPGLARIDTDGDVLFAKMYANVPGITATYATAAGVANDGRIWLVGGGNPTNMPIVSWFKAVIDSLTGELLHATVGQDGNYIVDGGRVLPSGIMIAAGKFVPQSEPGGPYRPRLLVFREQGTSYVALPLPTPVNDSAATLSPYPGVGVAIPLSDGRILQGSPMGGQNGGYDLATYAAVVELGATAAQDHVDTRFGLNGATQFGFRIDPACASNSPPLQRAMRFSNWLSRPVLAGVHSTTCSANPRNAFAARLLAPEDIFGDSFD